MITNLAFTVDWRIARPVAAVVGPVFQAGGPDLDMFVDLDGPGGATDARRMTIALGDASTFGDYNNKDVIMFTDGAGRQTNDNINGLNVDDFNLYRIVGLGDGSYKIYMNDVESAIGTGTMAAAASNPSAGSLFTTWQIGLQGSSNGTLDVDMRTDFIRLISGTALDIAPLFVPAVAFTNLVVDDVVGMAFDSAAGLSYSLEASDDLVVPDFQPTGATLEGSGQSLIFFDPTGFSTNRLYRIIATSL